MTKPNLIISFSGGETSAYMAWWLLTHQRDQFDQCRVVFANTGEEHEQTLIFVNRCESLFKQPVVWIERVIENVEPGSPILHKEVTFETASRNGEPFEGVVARYGIANSKYPHCSRNMKREPIEKYINHLEWSPRPHIAIGIRADEFDRVPAKPNRPLIFPLVKHHPRTKQQISAWWRDQPFRLEIPQVLSNCVWCWKKPERKLVWIARHHPEALDFPERMEKDYGRVGTGGTRRTWFRESRSTKDIRALEKRYHYIEVNDPKKDYADYGSCGESCEVFK